MDEEERLDAREMPERPAPEDEPEAGTMPLEGKGTPSTKSRLLEAGLLFAAFWLRAYLPLGTGSSNPDLLSPSYHLALLLELLPKTLLLLYLLARFESLGAFGLRRPRLRDLRDASLTALGALGVGLLPSAIERLLAAFGHSGSLPANPLLDGLRGAAAPALLYPLLLFSCLAVGYGEELFFRVYLLRRLREAGIPPAWAVVAGALIFGSAHGAQGLLGIVAASILGLYFGWRWHARGNFHEIALGHALYDAAILLVLLGSS